MMTMMMTMMMMMIVKIVIAIIMTIMLIMMITIIITSLASGCMLPSFRVAVGLAARGRTTINTFLKKENT